MEDTSISEIKKCISSGDIYGLMRLPNTEYLKILNDKETICGLLDSIKLQDIMCVILSLRNMKAEVHLIYTTLQCLCEGFEKDNNIKPLVEVLSELSTLDVGLEAMRAIMSNSNNLDNTKVISTLVMLKRTIDEARKHMSVCSLELSNCISYMNRLNIDTEKQ
ncbi:MAG: hypothetical protein ACRCZ9_12285 [Fusobacteriaceae bacterium]